MWDTRDCTQHYTKKDWYLQCALVPCKERNVINDPLVDRERILFPPRHIKLGLIKQFTKALGWGLLHLLVPGFSRTDHGEVDSWRSSAVAATQRSKVRKLNEGSGTGSVEGVCSGS